MRQHAVNHALAIIGEALGNLDEPTRERLTTAAIPVRSVINLRNRLVHEHRTLETEILWHAATEDMPPLLATIGELLPVRIEPTPPARGRCRGAADRMNSRLRDFSPEFSSNDENRILTRMANAGPFSIFFLPTFLPTATGCTAARIRKVS